MTTPTPHGAPELPGLALAKAFHETYERLAPEFGYTTRPETREFDPESPNGKLMTAVCAAIQQAAGAVPEAPHVTLTNAPRSTTGYHDPDRLAAWNAASPSPLGREEGKEGSSDHLVPCAGGGVTQPLTDEQIIEALDNANLHKNSQGYRSAFNDQDCSAETALEIARAIEAAHGINPGSAPREDGHG